MVLGGGRFVNLNNRNDFSDVNNIIDVKLIIFSWYLLQFYFCYPDKKL